MPCMNTSGDIPLGVFRGDVTPPATMFCRPPEWSAAYAGLRRRWTYRRGETGTENVRPFGSFQTVHMCTQGKRFAAAYAKSPNPRRGRAIGARPPFAQRGEPYRVT